MVRGLDAKGAVRRGGRSLASGVLDRHPPSQRHGVPSHGPCLQQHVPGYPLPRQADAGLQRPLASGNGPRGHRHPERRREEPGRKGAEPPRPGTRGVCRKGLGVEEDLRRPHHRPDEASGQLLRLEAGALHLRRGAIARRAFRVCAPLQEGLDLQGQVHHQLVLALPHGPLRPGGGVRREAG